MESLITKENLAQAERVFEEKASGFVPEVGIILGSGMSDLADAVKDAVVIPFTEIPHVAPATQHKGRFVLGTLAGKKVICQQGRLHAYEGYSAQQIAFPVYVQHALGIKTLIVTNASGGIDPTYNEGDIMLIEDHINFQMMNPVIGQMGELGPRFYDMTHAYDPKLRSAAKRVAAKRDITVHEGVYIGDLGPSFETPAEIRAFKVMGADAVGMSTVQEVIAANHVQVPVLGISLISNPAAGVRDEPLSMDDVFKAAGIGAANIQNLIEGVLEEL